MVNRLLQINTLAQTAWPHGQINPLRTVEVITGADDELAAGCGAGPVHANGGEHLIHTTCRSECEIAEGSEYSALKGKAVGAWVGTRRVSNADHAPVLRHLHGRSEARCAGVQGEAAGEWIAVSSNPPRACATAPLSEKGGRGM